MNRLAIFLICALLFTACSQKREATPEPSAEKYVIHTVRWPGETLGIISAWYTLSSSNWQEIARANPGLQVKNIRVGDTINIPEQMARRRDPMSEEFLVSVGTVPMKRDSKGITASVTEEPAVREDVQVVELSPADGPADLNSQLWLAVTFSDAPKVKSLLEQGADANFRQTNRAMLAWAAQNGSVDVAEALLAAKAKIDELDGVDHTALMRAADTNQQEMVETLIKAGANPSIKGPNGDTALSLAISSGYTGIVRALIKGGADVNVTTDDGGSLALTAAQYGYSEIITVLGEAKANLNVSNIVYTPLSYAIEQSNKELVATLLVAGADPNAKPKTGRVPLVMAMDNMEIFELLLDAKADPNLSDSSGETPLMAAVLNGYADRIERLIKAGADLNAKTESGSTALTYAENMYKTDIVELLKKNGAM